MISWTHIYPTPDLSRPHIQRESGDRFNDVGCLSQLSVVVKLMVAINVPPWDNPTTRVPSNNKGGSSMTKAVGFLASLFHPPPPNPTSVCPTPQPPDLPSLFFLSLRRSSVLIFDICPWRRPTSEGETPLRRSEGVVKKNTAAMTVNIKYDEIETTFETQILSETVNNNKSEYSSSRCHQIIWPISNVNFFTRCY